MCLKTTKTRPADGGPPLTHKRTPKSHAAQKMRIFTRKEGAESDERSSVQAGQQQSQEDTSRFIIIHKYLWLINDIS